MSEQVQHKILIWGSLASPALVLVFQWIGVIAAARAGRAGAWWCMLSGTLIATWALVAQFGMRLAALGWFGSRFAGEYRETLFARMCVSWVGALLFAMGFVLFAHRVVRVIGRAKELEGVCAAMAEEMGRKGERVS